MPLTAKMEFIGMTRRTKGIEIQEEFMITQHWRWKRDKNLIFNPVRLKWWQYIRGLICVVGISCRGFFSKKRRGDLFWATWLIFFFFSLANFRPYSVWDLDSGSHPFGRWRNECGKIFFVDKQTLSSYGGTIFGNTISILWSLTHTL